MEMETIYDAADFLAGLFASATPGAKLAPDLTKAPNIATDSVRFALEAGSMVDHFSTAPDADTKDDARARRLNPTSGDDWPSGVAALGDFVLLLSVDDLPATPFEFGPAETVVDAVKFLRWLQADVRRGATSPRALYGALQSDLRRLLRCVGLDNR
jgi:hypothetical protein